MKRITISLPDEMADSIARTSRIRRKTVSEVIRASLKKDFDADENQPRKVSFIGAGASEESKDWSDLHAELDKSWPDAIRRGWEK